MVVVWKCLLFLTILFLRASFYSMDYVYQYTAGSLSDSWSINFTIYTEEVKGIILQIFDSQANQFGMEVTRGNNLAHVRINYNKVYRLVLLKAPNKCRSCDVSNMTCDIGLRNGMLSVRSSRFDSQYFSVITEKNGTNGGQKNPKDENSDISIHLFPKNMMNMRETLYIMMGNIGPYLSEDGATVYPVRDQMEGCVEVFTHNDVQISLRENGTKLRWLCPHKCRDNICNGGLCHEQSDSAVLCDCTSTELNGMFCDRGLRNYVAGSNNSLEKVKDAHEVHLKLTWKHLLDKMYCLMDIFTGYKNATISINKSHLMLNSVNISDISMHGVNFVTVTIANNKLVVKTRRWEYKMEFSQDEKITINVGFSVRDTSCETFDGAYDLHFSPSQLRPTQYSTKLPNKELTSKYVGSTSSVEVSNRFISPQSSPRKRSDEWLIPFISGLCFLIFAAVVFVLYLKSKTHLDSRIKKIIAQSSFSLATSDHIFTETGLYGKVEDVYSYECIQDTEYTVINEM